MSDPTKAPLTPSASLMTRGRTFLFALAGGAAVGNLYWAQPLLDVIARDLGAPTSTAGWLVTATQIGYALGILLIVPLGDVRNRRRLVPTMLALSAVALLACAAAPSMGVLLIAITALGVATVSGQILVPLTGDLADDTNRGHVVGTVVSGVLTGILVSRTLSGFIAGFAGWRAVYVIAAVAAVALAALLARTIPPLAPKTTLRYPALIASVFSVVAHERTVRWTLVLGSTGFAAFTMFWTALTFHLSSPPFSYPVQVIGLFGLVGLAGAVAAQRSGRLHDRGWSLPATGAAWVLVLLAFVLAGLAGSSVVALLIAILVLDIAMQANGILNQARLFAVSGEARSRINTAYVVSNFIGGAVGSALATVLWDYGRWGAITTTGAVLAGFALVVWLLGRRGPLLGTTNALLSTS
jgi:predicted MFS family arabinose efflux permease